MDAEELRARWLATQAARGIVRPRGLLEPSRPVLSNILEMCDKPRAEQQFEHALPHRMESPLEERMAVLLVKVLDPACLLEAQHKVLTPFGRFRLDFLVAGPGGRPRVALECDGAKHHTGYRDDWRDAAILGAEAVDGIVRVRGRDLHRYPWDILHALASRLPNLFTPRGRALAERLATPAICEGLLESPGHVSAWYPPPANESGEVPSGWVDCLIMTTEGTLPRFSSSWQERYEFLLKDPALGVDGWAAIEKAEVDKILAKAGHE